MLEERRSGDTAVVGAHNTGAGRGGELLCVAIPRRPTGGIGVDEHHGVTGFDGGLVGTGGERIEPVDPEESRLERQFLEVAVLDPTDREVEAALRDPCRLGV
ncbi:hypothetical protein MGAD_43320 [Mycolicibacterium gadium]|uniref:Uncharacterized protein n=1 Tax=Mycolicibacterium gadium TaxID=1794 RepID=A0A7I7WTD7_MYCGU|nr:hypothetical protein MGAD_43320 [Mycolicibacterium gadium]